ncbi:protein lethal(2)k10201-like isoform X3 [Rhodnius prolixus]|uniref:protein lethal(2)k10201-like isoform X3 n=1 Tax=Rhodnius prolixus TaxID=13249 RepID=UPI003D18F70D
MSEVIICIENGTNFHNYVANQPVESRYIKCSINMADLLDKLTNYAAEVQHINDTFFDEGNRICRVYSRRGIVDEDEEDFCHQQYETFKCEIANCCQEFDTVLKYELHYNSCHRYSCSYCKKHLPSPHLLDLHVSETHDSFFKAAAERKPMYKCFVESCDAVSNNAQDRRSHCIEVHRFPHDFRYDTRRPLKKKGKMAEKNQMEISHSETDSKQEETPTTSSASVPEVSAFSRPFTFGHKKSGKVFNTKKSKTSKSLDMTELMESLPSDSMP